MKQLIKTRVKSQIFQNKRRVKVNDSAEKV